jgi:hypothetical protein
MQTRPQDSEFNGPARRDVTLADLRAGLKLGFLMGAAGCAVLLPHARPSLAVGPGSSADADRRGVAVATSRTPAHVRFDGTSPSADARKLADWIANTRDSGGLAFAILDKRGARLYVFDHAARFLSSSLVLLGSAIGDDSAPGIGNRPLAQVRYDERTTAAGRFVSDPGHDEAGEPVIWVDYAAALAIHRVKVVDPKERRFERIGTDSVSDKRISNGCINVPIAFFDTVVEPTLGRTRAVVYVLPEVKTLRQVFPAADVPAPNATEGARDPD